MTSSSRARTLCALFLACAPAARAQFAYSPEQEILFRAAVARFDSGKMREAVVGFDRCIAEFPFAQRVTAAYVMKGKALERLGENLDAARTLKDFLSRFPSSAYVPDAELTLGVIYARIGRTMEAMDTYLAAYRVLTGASPPRLVHSIRAAMDSALAVPGISAERFLPGAATRPERAYLWWTIAGKDAAEGNAVAAAVALDSLERSYPGSPFSSAAAELRRRITVRSTVKLGILLPLMKGGEPSGTREVGIEVEEGIEFALERFAAEPGRRVTVSAETRDTGRDPSLAAAGARDLAAEGDVVGIVGPVFSPEASAAGAVAAARGIPLVTPTANADGIAAAGRYVFQANPDYASRGRAMARYAVRVKGFHTLAVLAPADTYARFLAEAFIAEASRLGARVLNTQWYQRGTSDLKPQLEAIRRSGMLAGADPLLSFAGRVKPATLMKFADLGVPLKRIDSLMNRSSTISARELLGDRARTLLDSLDIPVVYDESHVDSLEYPVEGIDAIYAPISGADEIGIVSSQIVYFHFQTQVLGSGEWNSFAELNANRRYADGVVFETDTYIDTTGGGYASFADSFAVRFHQAPTNNVLFGYDTAALVLSLIGGGAVTRDALQKALAAVRGYRGIHSMIAMGPDRVNGALTLLRYEQDEIRKVGEISGGAGLEGGDEGAHGR